MELPHIERLLSKYQKHIAAKEKDEVTPTTIQNLRYIELIGSKCLQALLMKIVFIELKKG